METRSTYNVRSYNTTVIGGYHVESKLVHISLHNVSSFSVTRDLTLNIAQPSPSLLHLARSEAYFMFVTSLAMVMSDGQAPGADHWPRVPADSGHHNINPAQWDNSTWHKQSRLGLWPGPPTTQWPSGILERPSLDSLIFNGLMKTLIFTGWTDIWWTSILNSLNWTISLGFVESGPGVHFISPNFPADLPSQMLSERAFSGNLSELNWTWIASLSVQPALNINYRLTLKRLGMRVKFSMLQGL